MMCEQTGNLELDAEIDGKSTENDFYFNYLTIDTDDEDDFELSDAPEDPTVENIEFKEDVCIELYEIVPLPTLQQLAAFVTVIELWREVIRSENVNRITYSHPTYDFLTKEYKDVEGLLNQLPFPSLIRELVRNCLGPVKEELDGWMGCYEYLIPEPMKVPDLIYCEWLSEGKIDHRKTALNMLSNRKMNAFDRFKIMSKYCLEDEIKKMPLESIPERIIRRKSFSETPSRYYWFYYMNDDLDKLRKRINQPIESFIITDRYVDTCSAIDYFWDRLNINEQISAALVLLQRNPDIQNVQRHLFSKMNQFQKYHVLLTIPSNIIRNFYHDKFYELAFLTFVRIGNALTYEKFEDLFIKLLWCGHLDNDEATHCLAKIWNNLGDDYKTRAFQSLTEFIIDKHCTWLTYEGGLPNNTDFLETFLSSGSVEFRRNILFNHGSELVLNCDPSGFNRVIRLCIRDSNDLVLFEKYLLSSDDMKYHGLGILEERFGDLKELAEFLRNFISNSDDKIKLIGKILVSAENEFRDEGGMKRWNNAIKFIDGYFETSSSSQIMKYRRHIVWSFVNFHAQCKYDYQDLHQFIQTITQVLEADSLKRYKNVALKRFQRQCRWLEFDKIKIHQFLLWCLNYDYVEMRRFVKSLSIDRIFWDVWENMKQDWFFESERSRQEVSQKFAPIDKILLWYFEKSDRVNKFKLEKIFGFRHKRPAMFVKSNNEVQEVFTKNVIPWFFEGDREEIAKFKNLYKNNDIVKSIDIDS